MRRSPALLPHGGRPPLALLALILPLVGLLAPSSRAAEADPAGVSAEQLAALVDEARGDLGLEPLARDAALAELAARRALERAARPHDERLQAHRSAFTQLPAADRARFEQLREQVFLSRRVEDPAAEALSQWRGLSESWAFALSEQAALAGFGAARDEEGWSVLVALVAEPLRDTSDPPIPRLDEAAREELEERVFEAANEARISEGLAPLRLDPRLVLVAREHAFDMARAGRLSHRSTKGLMVDARVRAHGIAYARVAENLALVSGKRPVRRAVESWLQSEGHRRNLLDPLMREGAIGAAQGPGGEIFLVQVFLRVPGAREDERRGRDAKTPEGGAR